MSYTVVSFDETVGTNTHSGSFSLTGWGTTPEVWLPVVIGAGTITLDVDYTFGEQDCTVDDPTIEFFVYDSGVQVDRVVVSGSCILSGSLAAETISLDAGCYVLKIMMPNGGNDYDLGSYSVSATSLVVGDIRIDGVAAC